MVLAHRGDLQADKGRVRGLLRSNQVDGRAALLEVVQDRGQLDFLDTVGGDHTDALSGMKLGIAESRPDIQQSLLRSILSWVS